MSVLLFSFLSSRSTEAVEIPITITSDKTYQVDSGGKVSTYASPAGISTVIFQGSVVAAQGDLKITGDRASARLQKSDNGKIEEIDVTGAPAYFCVENWLERA